MDAIDRALSHLHAHAGGKVTLADLAHAAGMGKFQLVRAFAERVGTTPHRYLVLVRVRWAQALLARGDAVAAVAARVGFVDQAHLTRRFKEVVGVTPAVYARACASPDDDAPRA